jgi:hypothetical protein
VPPLIVQPHHGPTSHTSLRLELRTQFFTSRGFVVATVDYRGSTGYGHAYRTQLDGQWGILDVQDCVDVNRTIISGASAGGFTALRTLATDRFAAAASWYGITDLAIFRAHVPRFPRHHTDHLVGPWLDAAPIYRERSPVHNAAAITQPVLLNWWAETPSDQHHMILEWPPECATRGMSGCSSAQSQAVSTLRLLSSTGPRRLELVSAPRMSATCAKGRASATGHGNAGAGLYVVCGPSPQPIVTKAQEARDTLVQGTLGVPQPGRNIESLDA